MIRDGVQVHGHAFRRPRKGIRRLRNYDFA